MITHPYQIELIARCFDLNKIQVIAPDICRRVENPTINADVVWGGHLDQVVEEMNFGLPVQANKYGFFSGMAVQRCGMAGTNTELPNVKEVIGVNAIFMAPWLIDDLIQVCIPIHVFSLKHDLTVTHFPIEHVEVGGCNAYSPSCSVLQHK
jgi:hypothetical protein